MLRQPDPACEKEVEKESIRYTWRLHRTTEDQMLPPYFEVEWLEPDAKGDGFIVTRFHGDPRELVSSVWESDDDDDD